MPDRNIPLSLVVLADDFTGACDTGLQFANHGLHTVACETDRIPDLDLTSVSVLVCDTETRNASRPEARGYVTEACGHVRALKSAAVYKKVDSALRGHLGAEIHTIMTELDIDLGILAPAFPAAGRVTVGGYHLVHGVPVDRTEVGHDPGAPVRGSYLPHLLDEEPGLQVKLLQLEDVAQGADHVSSLIESFRDVGRTLIVADAASEEDLVTIAGAAARLNRPPLLCGSAGLANHIPAAFVWVGEQEEVVSAQGPVLVVVGSNESVTRDQIGRLKQDLALQEWEVHADHSAYAWARPHVPSVVSALAAELESGRSAILSLVGLHAGMEKSEAAQAMSVLGEMGSRVVARQAPAGLVLTGGWTTVETLRALGAHGVRLSKALDVATPLCQIIGGLHEGLNLVTKGGALGTIDTLSKVVRYFESPEIDRGDLPVLGITMGDVCGVGPEIIAKAFELDDLYQLCQPLVIGDPAAMEEACLIVGARLDVNRIDKPEDARYARGSIDVLDLFPVDRQAWEKGKVSAEAGRAAAEWVIEAVRLAVADRIDGIVTAPLNKEAMNLAGYKYPGHTELLAERAGGHDVRLMLASERMSVAHVTGHVALHDVSERLTQKRVFDTITMTRDALMRMGKRSPRIAVTGLNPHAGENGLFGEEDDLIIKPAVEQARAEGVEIDGPLPADATFFKAYAGQYDGVVAMYHDQGHAPMKLVAFDTAVNVTLGLPIVRTSVDHGTAFDIAGTGRAKEGNLIHAVRVGAQLAVGRKKERSGK